MVFKNAFLTISLLISGTSSFIQATDFLTYFTETEKRSELLASLPSDEKNTFEKLFAFYASLSPEDKTTFEAYIKEMDLTFTQAITKVETLNQQSSSLLERCKSFCGFNLLKIGVTLSAE